MTEPFERDAESNSAIALEWALKLAAHRAVQRCDQLAQSTDDDVGLTRTFCSPAMKRAHQQLAGWFEQANLDSVLDPAGNLIGRPRPTETVPGRSVFMIGSHLDTVVNAGRFDGALGVLLGLGTAEVFQSVGINLGFDIHVVAFSEEEGVRYQMPFIGSRGIAGKLGWKDFDRVDAEGISIRQALTGFGCDPDAFQSARYEPKHLIGFLEAHMEQATLLEESNLPVGVVSAIAGQTRATILFEGQSGHAGTVPHGRRRDALAAAAELILQIERLGQDADGLFATIGNVIPTPGLSNVICGRAELRLDLRHENDDRRLAAFAKITQLHEKIALSRGLKSSLISVQHSPAVPMDLTISDCLCHAIEDLGWPPKKMVSGAGHDAMILSSIAPAGMLFVRCRKGISHHPAEFVSPEDITVALKTLVGALLGISATQVSR